MTTDTKLNQIVAVEKGMKDRTNKSTAPLFHAASSAALFSGLSKTYRPRFEDGDTYAGETVRVRHTVPEILDSFRKPTGELLDVILTKETANCEARADVVVNGVTVIEQAPVTFLLQLQKYLEREVRGLVTSLPTLDPAVDWSESAIDRQGVYLTDVQTRNKQKKITRPLELAPATDKHPAQVQLISEDIIEGYWDERRFSGAIPAQRKQELIARTEELIDAVKKAREEANDIVVEQRKVGDRIFDHLFG